jgi:hypothetical protein
VVSGVKDWQQPGKRKNKKKGKKVDDADFAHNTRIEELFRTAKDVNPENWLDSPEQDQFDPSVEWENFTMEDTYKMLKHYENRKEMGSEEYHAKWIVQEGGEISRKYMEQHMDEDSEMKNYNTLELGLEDKVLSAHYSKGGHQNMFADSDLDEPSWYRVMDAASKLSRPDPNFSFENYIGSQTFSLSLFSFASAHSVCCSVPTLSFLFRQPFRRDASQAR